MRRDGNKIIADIEDVEYSIQFRGEAHRVDMTPEALAEAAAMLDGKDGPARLGAIVGYVRRLVPTLPEDVSFKSFKAIAESITAFMQAEEAGAENPTGKTPEPRECFDSAGSAGNSAGPSA